MSFSLAISFFGYRIYIELQFKQIMGIQNKSAFFLVSLQAQNALMDTFAHKLLSRIRPHTLSYPLHTNVPDPDLT